MKTNFIIFLLVSLVLTSATSFASSATPDAGNQLLSSESSVNRDDTLPESSTDDCNRGWGFRIGLGRGFANIGNSIYRMFGYLGSVANSTKDYLTGETARQNAWLDFNKEMKRRIKIRNNEKKLKAENEIDAATKIQSIERMRQAKRLKAIKKEAKRVQAAIERAEKLKAENEIDAATKIQSIERMRKAKQRLKAIKKEAKRVQAAIERAEKERAEKERAKQERAEAEKAESKEAKKRKKAMENALLDQAAKEIEETKTVRANKRQAKNERDEREKARKAKVAKENAIKVKAANEKREIEELKLEIETAETEMLAAEKVEAEELAVEIEGIEKAEAVITAAEEFNAASKIQNNFRSIEAKKRLEELREKKAEAEADKAAKAKAQRRGFLTKAVVGISALVYNANQVRQIDINEQPSATNDQRPSFYNETLVKKPFINPFSDKGQTSSRVKVPTAPYPVKTEIPNPSLGSKSTIVEGTNVTNPTAEFDIEDLGTLNLDDESNSNFDRYRDRDIMFADISEIDPEPTDYDEAGKAIYTIASGTDGRNGKSNATSKIFPEFVFKSRLSKFKAARRGLN